jgi:hypothetical protein
MAGAARRPCHHIAVGKQARAGLLSHLLDARPSVLFAGSDSF